MATPAIKGIKYAIVAIDYYTKLVEVGPLNKISKDQVNKFIRKNIVCRFGLPHTLVSNNGTQFISRKLKDLCN